MWLPILCTEESVACLLFSKDVPEVGYREECLEALDGLHEHNELAALHQALLQAIESDAKDDPEFLWRTARSLVETAAQAPDGQPIKQPAFETALHYAARAIEIDPSLEVAREWVAICLGERPPPVHRINLNLTAGTQDLTSAFGALPTNHFYLRKHIADRTPGPFLSNFQATSTRGLPNLTGTWLFTEQRNLDSFMKEVGVSWSLRTLASSFNYDIGNTKHVVEHSSANVFKAVSFGRRKSAMEVTLGR
jgi:hypothetical protein